MRNVTWPMHLPDERLDDGEVSLRPYTSADAEQLFRAVCDERAWEHLPGRIPSDFGELDAGILARVADGHWLTFTVRRAGAVVGRTSVIWESSAPEGVEIGGTQFDPAVWGTGVNTRVKRMLIREVFDQGAAWIGFRTDERNSRSAAAIRKLGATDLGVHQDTLIRRDGSVRRSRFFRLDRPTTY
ncbi:GNAT family N-acetyltransferase [Nocardia amikacinitolerans]|uniref:GNAT family N-acetyltransferase n=1 Tax=Nocardia amikacinitolerans TaxID=756689 RepID=UPI00082C1AF4|nr:GNAT family N-acetyltransferase [Nocardia amikacinitolerans]